LLPEADGLLGPARLLTGARRPDPGVHEAGVLLRGAQEAGVRPIQVALAVGGLPGVELVGGLHAPADLGARELEEPGRAGVARVGGKGRLPVRLGGSGPARLERAARRPDGGVREAL